MPFDALPNERQGYLLQKLEAVSQLLSHERQWCQNRLRGPDGSHCLVGALIDAKARLVLYRPLLNAVRTVTGIRHLRLESFNDSPYTDFARVQTVLDRVRIDIMLGNLPRGLSYALRYRLARFLERRYATAVARCNDVPASAACDPAALAAVHEQIFATANSD
jgi:hypothetical protein